LLLRSDVVRAELSSIMAQRGGFVPALTNLSRVLHVILLHHFR